MAALEFEKLEPWMLRWIERSSDRGRSHEKSQSMGGRSDVCWVGTMEIAV